MKYSYFIALIMIFFSQSLAGQSEYYREYEFTRADSLRGDLRLERTCFDVKHYALDLKVDLESQSISGSNIISFFMSSPSDEIQIDLFENMHIDSVLLNGGPSAFRRECNAIFIQSSHLLAMQSYKLKILYNGKPKAAISPPWDGGFQWTSDDLGNPWINVSCQGIGASLWWPNKDHPSDEADSMSITMTVPKPLSVISNGNLISSVEQSNSTSYKWEVGYPINNYNVTFSIGIYEHFSDVYTSKEKGSLSCDYYVMPYNLKKARQHFKQVNGVLEAFEHYFGPYPFWDDGYALVEVPYLGMEHQSAIAYGNKYNRGYMGGMIPEHMNWDYIIVHETGHEYWGNAVTAGDFGELWIQESFCTYMEALYIEYHMGKEEACGYLNTQRIHQNQQPIIAPLRVNFDQYASSDHYFKGAWVIHTLRSSIDNDELFFSILRKFYNDFKFKNASSDDFFKIVNAKTGKDYGSFFRQYLYHPDIPKLEYKLAQKPGGLTLKYKWNADVLDFSMPIEVGSKDRMHRIFPKVDQWQSIDLEYLSRQDLKIASDLYLIDIVRIQ